MGQSLCIVYRNERKETESEREKEMKDRRVGDWVHWHRLDGPHATGTTTTHDALRTTDGEYTECAE